MLATELELEISKRIALLQAALDAGNSLGLSIFKAKLHLYDRDPVAKAARLDPRYKAIKLAHEHEWKDSSMYVSRARKADPDILKALELRVRVGHGPQYAVTPELIDAVLESFKRKIEAGNGIERAKKLSGMTKKIYDVARHDPRYKEIRSIYEDLRNKRPANEWVPK